MTKISLTYIIKENLKGAKLTKQKRQHQNHLFQGKTRLPWKISTKKKEVKTMVTMTIYATGKYKPKEKVGCSGYKVFKGSSQKPTEKVSQFDSESKIFTQLSALIQSISTIKKEKNVDEVKLFTDFSLIQDFLNGSVLEWERNNWARTSGRPIPHAELWKELSDLCVEYNIQMIATEDADDKMADLSKKVQNESKKPMKTPAKKETKPKAKTEVKKNSAPPVVKEVAEKVKETPKKSTAKKGKVATKPVKKEVAPIPTPVTEPAPKKETVVEKVVATSTEPTVKIDADLLKNCETLFGELGLDVNTAITMFLKDSLRKKGLNIDLKL